MLFLFTRHSSINGMVILSFCLSLMLLTAAGAKEAEQCQSCHQDTVHQWTTSDHAKAMAPATVQTVLGDFNGAELTHFSQHVRFTLNDGVYTVELTHGEHTQQYTIDYVFGHYPLQQYLVKAKGGRYQVLPFSWDSRAQDAGGQKWFPVYADEDIKPNDRLHWQQPMQNWNGMCADCHSSGLKRQFDHSSAQFNTVFDEINVSCQSCHTTMSATHSQSRSLNNNSDLSSTHAAGLTAHEQKALGYWLRKPSDSVARWHGETRDNRFMETCFGCHSLRSPLTDGIAPKDAFLDQFSPSFIAPPLYFADGKVKEEVYVYGSFLQSKMFAAGVNCLDCHDPHTLKVKVEGNGLCLQCHSAETYEATRHSHHSIDSLGNQCVNCHMPETTFMGVDARREHSFTVPRPLIAKETGSPSVCLSCHETQSHDWAQKAINHWFGDEHKMAPGERGFIDFMQDKVQDEKAIFAIIADTQLSVIKRASVIARLPQVRSQVSSALLAPYFSHDEPLIRLATAQASVLLSPSEKQQLLLPLITDEFRAIRVAAANQLAGLALDSQPEVKRALAELMLSNQVDLWRGEGNLNQSLVEYQLGNTQAALAYLQKGTEIDPYFEVNYINLADLYRSIGDSQNERLTFERAIEHNPNSDIVFYSYGMFHVRSGQLEKAVAAFGKALDLAPNNPSNWYIYALALDKQGLGEKALDALKQGVEMTRDPQLLQLGFNLAQKYQHRQAYQYFMQFAN